MGTQGTVGVTLNTFSIYLTYQRAAAATASRATPVRVQRSIILLSLSLPSPQLVELRSKSPAEAVYSQYPLVLLY